jgi:NhaA family Na+:H+ antiporter
MKKPQPRPPSSILRRLIESEASGGLVLLVVAVLAVIVANSPAADSYFSALHFYLGGLSVLHWINDGLMALFFLLVGLEIKRELIDGQLSTWPRRILPGVAAAGGMAVPALIYVAVAAGAGSGEALRGWAIPAATDIAFALGVLALLGPRVPVSLKVFLTALAILDDLGAIAIIAVFYTESLHFGMLALAALCIAILIGLGRLKVTALWPYLLVGAALWWFVLQSGIHATLAGVALALTIPVRRASGTPESARSPLHRLEHGLQPWVAFLVVPVFGFANAGVSFAGLPASALLDPVTLGIALGLFAGKQIGVFGSAFLAVRAGLADLPAKASWAQLYGVALLCGIGFTMSLFIGLLAFDRVPHLQDETKLGVLCGSAIAAIAGAIVLGLARPGKGGVSPPPSE